MKSLLGVLNVLHVTAVLYRRDPKRITAAAAVAIFARKIIVIHLIRLIVRDIHRIAHGCLLGCRHIYWHHEGHVGRDLDTWLAFEILRHIGLHQHWASSHRIDHVARIRSIITDKIANVSEKMRNQNSKLMSLKKIRSR